MNYLLKITENFDRDIAYLYSSFMPRERREFFQNCKEETRKLQTVAAYLTLCFALKREYGLEELRLQFSYTEQGKPFLTEQPQIHFNFSHSGEYVLCALSNRPVGCDIQKKPIDDFPDVALRESVFKLGEGREKVCTHSKEEPAFSLAISGYGEVNGEIYSLSCEELLADIAERSTLSLYAEINARAKEVATQTPLRMFREQVRKTPDKIAVEDKRGRITYRELDEYSDGLAFRLVEAGVKPQEGVLLSALPSVAFSVAEWAILKAGAYYVPLCNRWTEERVDYIVRDCGAKVMLMDESELFSGCAVEKKLRCDSFERREEKFPLVEENVEEIFYTIYTSGSTGNPKGVMVSKGNVATFSQGDEGSYFQLLVGENAPRVACICPVSFDMSVGENTTTLLNGGSVIFADEEEQYPDNFGAFLCSHDVKIVWATPSKFKMYLKTPACREGLSQLKAVVLAGESLDLETATLSQAYPFALYNTYAPTETTIISTYYLVKKGDFVIPIGKPFSGESAYVISEENTLCEVGEKGELCIGGGCVALGYKNNVEQTQARFVQNPFGAGRIYRTGDIVSLREDGNLLFFGRKDHQVKVNGFRVELEEIEAVVYRCTGVKCVVLYQNGRLIAVVEGDKSKLEPSTLKEALPDYMIPALTVGVREFPLNANGKIDRKQLSERFLALGSEKPYRPPQTPLQQTVLSAWESVLAYRPIGVDDEYFALGGDSIGAMRIASQLRASGYKISMFDVLNAKTVSALAEEMQAQRKEEIGVRERFFSAEECAPEGAEIAVEEILRYQENFHASETEKTYIPLKVHDKMLRASSQCEAKIFQIVGTNDEGRVKDAMRKLIAENGAFRIRYSPCEDLCRQQRYFDGWYIPTVDIQKINKSFLWEMSRLAEGEKARYLSYALLVRQGEALIAVLALHSAFTDRKTQAILGERLGYYLREKTEMQNLALDPCDYASLVRSMEGEFLKNPPASVAEEIEAFARLSAKEEWNTLLKNCACGHFVYALQLSERSIAAFYKNPLNFLSKIYYPLLREATKQTEIPIYVIDQNRNERTEKLVHSVIDFIPVVLTDKRRGCYKTVKAMTSHRAAGDLIIENQTWDNSTTMLPFLNFLPEYADGEGELVAGETELTLTERKRGGKQISLSGFPRAGKLFLAVEIPLEEERVRTLIQKTIGDIK